MLEGYQGTGTQSLPIVAFDAAIFYTSHQKRGFSLARVKGVHGTSLTPTRLFCVLLAFLLLLPLGLVTFVIAIVLNRFRCVVTFLR